MRPTAILLFAFVLLSSCKTPGPEDAEALQAPTRDRDPATSCGPKDYGSLSQDDGALALSRGAEVPAGLREFAIDLYNLNPGSRSTPNSDAIRSVLDPHVSAYCEENPGQYFLRYVRASGGDLVAEDEEDEGNPGRSAESFPRVWMPDDPQAPLPGGWVLRLPEASQTGGTMLEFCECSGGDVDQVGLDRLLGLDERSFALGPAETETSDDDLPDHVEALHIAEAPDTGSSACPDDAHQVTSNGRKYCQYEVTAKVASYIAPFDNTVGSRQNPGQCHYKYAAKHCGMTDWEPGLREWPTLRRELFANHYNELFRDNSGYAGGSWGYALFCVPSFLGVGTETNRPRGYQDVKTRFFCPLEQEGKTTPVGVKGHTPTWDFDKPERTGHEVLTIYGTHNETGEITTDDRQNAKRVHVGWWGHPNNKPNYYAMKASLTDHGTTGFGNTSVTIPFSRHNTGRGQGNIWADFYLDVTCQNGQLRRGHAAVLQGSNFPTQWAHAKIESVGGRKKTYEVTMRRKQGKFCELFKTEIKNGNQYPQTHVLGGSPYLVLEDHFGAWPEPEGE